MATCQFSSSYLHGNIIFCNIKFDKDLFLSLVGLGGWVGGWKEWPQEVGQLFVYTPIKCGNDPLRSHCGSNLILLRYSSTCGVTRSWTNVNSCACFMGWELDLLHTSSFSLPSLLSPLSSPLSPLSPLLFPLSPSPLPLPFLLSISYQPTVSSRVHLSLVMLPFTLAAA